MKGLMEFMSSYPNFFDTSIQTFDDNKERKDQNLARIYENTTENYKEAEKLNKQWAWVFFSVNSMSKGKRSKEAVTKINAWVCEVDNTSKKEQMEMIVGAPIEPDCIVESKKSYHMYRFAKDGTKENYEKIGMWLREYFDGDVVVARDYSRVLRLPWFYHCKDEDDKFLVECVYIFDRNHTEQEMMEAYPYTPPKTEYKPKKVSYNGDDDFWYVLNSWDAGDILKRLSGTYLVSGESIEYKRNSNGTHQIVCNKKATWCRLDKDWKIGSHDKGWPSRVNWIKWYWKADDKDIAERAKSNCKDLLPEKFFRKEAKVVRKKKWLSFDARCYTWWLPKIDKALWMPQTNDLVVFAWYPFMWKTAFTYYMAKTNAQKWVKTVYYTLELNADTLKLRTARERVWISKYQRQTGGYTNEQKQRVEMLYKSFDQIANFELLGFDKPPTVQDIMNDMEKRITQWVELFFIDNLGKFTGWKENDVYAEVTNQLQTFKNKYPVCVVLLHHLNKPKVTEMSHPWWPSKLRWTQKIMDNATIVAEIWRDQDEEATYVEQKTVEIHQYKDTQGWSIASVDVFFDKWRYTENLSLK